jgi:hypothetical protein
VEEVLVRGRSRDPEAPIGPVWLTTGRCEQPSMAMRRFAIKVFPDYTCVPSALVTSMGSFVSPEPGSGQGCDARYQFWLDEQSLVITTLRKNNAGVYISSTDKRSYKRWTDCFIFKRGFGAGKGLGNA